MIRGSNIWVRYDQFSADTTTTIEDSVTFIKYQELNLCHKQQNSANWLIKPIILLRLLEKTHLRKYS